MRVAYKTKVAKNSIGKEQECVTDRAAEPEPITKHAGAGNIGGKESSGCWTTNDYRAIEDLVTIQEAADHCMQAGARLCTREEVAKGVINAAKNWQKELQPVRCQGVGSGHQHHVTMEKDFMLPVKVSTNMSASINV